MELLSSIKKQRELFAQTLSTANMPRELSLDTSLVCDEETIEQFQEATPGDDTTRKALSPSNRKHDLGNARMLVSSLRSKREDLIKRFENTHLTTGKASSPPENEENNSDGRERQAMDPPFSFQVASGRTSKEKNDIRRTSVRTSEFNGFQGLKPVAESLAAFERTGTNNDKPSISQNTAKAVDAQWIKRSDGKDSLKNFNNEANGLESIFRRRAGSSSGAMLDESIHATDGAPTGKTAKARKSGISLDGSWIKRSGSTDEKEQGGNSDLSSRKTEEMMSRMRSQGLDTPSLHNGSTAEEQKKSCFSPQRQQRGMGDGFAGSDGTKQNLESPTVTLMKKKAEPTKIPAYSTKVLSPGKGMSEKRKGNNEASWIKRPECESSGLPVRAPQSPVFVKPSDSCNEESVTRPSAILAASRFKKSGRANSEGTLQTQQTEVDSSWINHNRVSIGESEQHSKESHSSAKRKCDGVPWTKQERTKLQEHQVGAGRKSTGDVSWIKHGKDSEASATSDDKTHALPKAPWVEALEKGEKSSFVSPSMLMNTTKRDIDRSILRKNGRHSGRLLCEPLVPTGSKPTGLKTSFLSSAGTDRETVGCEANSRVVVRNTPERDGAGDHAPSTKKPLSAKVLLFESKRTEPSDTTAVVKATKEYWESPQRRGRAGSRKEITEKKANISLIINAMEKFSMGNELERVGTVEQSDEEALVIGEVNSQASYRPDDEIVTSNSAVSAAESIPLEYGDATFSLTSGSQENCEARENEHSFEKYEDEASEGSTYKIDNYQKDFNQSIPIQSPWMHMSDNFTTGYGIDRGAMSIVSVVPSTEQRQTYDDEKGFYAAVSTRQENSIVEEETQPTDRSLATRHSSNHKVARNSLLSAKKKVPSRSKSENYFSQAQAQADPIFQVTDDPEQKKLQNIIKILSKTNRDGEIEFEQAENKPSKSMFKKLKKGLGSTLSRGKDDSDLTSEYAPEDDAGDVVCPDSRTTVSSITRSVYSTPTDSSQKSGDRSMPLGVLNGFFKAARKLQKSAKRKTKTKRRGRSMSTNKKPSEIGEGPTTDPKPTQAITIRPPLPQSPVQPWQGIQTPAGPYPNAAVVAGRGLRAYGVSAISRKKEVKATNETIKSLASW